MAAIEKGAPYNFYDPSNSFGFALNQPTAVGLAPMCGYVTDITGLDSPEVRENAQNNPSADGGQNNAFWRGRRPFTFSGIIVPQFPILNRAISQERIERVMGACMRASGFVTWLASDGIQKYIYFRQQQPVRITDGQSAADKRFTLSGVCDDWRIRALTLNSVASVAVGNGNADAAGYYTITGPATSPVVITNTTSGKKITYNAAIAGGHSVIIDTINSTFPVVSDFAVGVMYQNIDPLNTDWTIAISPGSNTFTISSGTLNVKWYDSWL